MCSLTTECVLLLTGQEGIILAVDCGSGGAEGGVGTPPAPSSSFPSPPPHHLPAPPSSGLLFSEEERQETLQELAADFERIGQEPRGGL